MRIFANMLLNLREFIDKKLNILMKNFSILEKKKQKKSRKTQN